MNKHLPYILFTLFWIIAYNISGQICKESIGLAERKMYQNKTAFTEHTGPEYNYDVKYYRTYWEIDPRIFFIKGSVTTYFAPTLGAFSQMGFDMNYNLTVDSVIYHHSKLVNTKDLANSELIINFSSPLPIAKLDSITVYYHGIPNNNNQSINQTFHSNIPVIWTLSEPYGARDWWPCKQSLNDKADSIDIYVKTIQGNLVASNGLLVSSIKHDSSITYHWKHRYPIATYLIALAVTNYAQYSIYAHVGPKPGDSLLILNYVYPEDSAAWYAPSLYARNIMEYYVKTFGAYPFDKEKYGHAEFDFGGGMEHQTMSFMEDMDFSLVAHEMAHHWFGDKVTCGSWADIWLNEGFAVFCEGLCEENIAGPSAWQSWLISNIDQATTDFSGSVFVNDTTNDGRIFDPNLTYAKGGMVVRMLRFVLGDSAFFKGCQAYLTDKNLAYAFASTKDLQNHLQASSGMNLDTFFNEWIYGQGYPLFTIYWKQADNDLNITLQQKTVNAAVPFFHIPVPIRIRMNGKDSTFNIEASSPTQDFNIPITAKVDSLMADPDQWLIARCSVFALDSLPGNPLDIYPNPATNTITLNLHDSYTGDFGDIVIYDATGRFISEMKGINTSSVTINTANLADGIYFLKYKSNLKTLQEKFLKME